MKYSLVALAASAFALTACIDPAGYVSEPVRVSTPQGTVVCQLYRLDQVVWDEAISAPQGMTINQADKICRAEGHRILKSR